MDDEDKIDSVSVVKNATDLQRLKLEKLMKNPVSYFSFFYLVIIYCL